jgi:phosphoesterase RecJ-like protein
VRLSLRSKGQLDVARIAASFGGGGHLHAGGCTLEGTLRGAAEIILETMRRELVTIDSGRSGRKEELNRNLVG